MEETLDGSDRLFWAGHCVSFGRCLSFIVIGLTLILGTDSALLVRWNCEVSGKVDLRQIMKTLDDVLKNLLFRLRIHSLPNSF